ncbi:hypothetical protein SAICODRAFT_26799 [Saitoella complicata NRRL Y-17804]|uniref:Uncharacterized protein n=1 Tax=Saitoella complicata (strain BCRC 22490 / CBS 7301 / JCM 7358 / NBRC 10748 / NRRL Y-17804) TaxID=698492 RepID=A0A0E9NEM4_SAICN|nr:uncharacterized protein SAICODRAFT_26799 [Saitoella complicata NRRL Y-17804]ODQ51369.1 hypothetical protein SAICODRAFT_26799 [Saitoella complicata NRRL Y-17804]GAO48263.1 hypothetical protein G7K_2443-t1 [Saitoella complicata NRRL Y-17804]
MPPVYSTTTRKSERTHEENQERAYIAASRRSDRSLEARIESARRASEIHKKRTGKALRVTEADVQNEEMYEEEDDDLPPGFRGLTGHLTTGRDGFDWRISSYVAGSVAFRSFIGDRSLVSQNPHDPAYMQQGMGMPQFDREQIFPNLHWNPVMTPRALTPAEQGPAPAPIYPRGQQPYHRSQSMTHRRASSSTTVTTNVDGGSPGGRSMTLSGMEGHRYSSTSGSESTSTSNTTPDVPGGHAQGGQGQGMSMSLPANYPYTTTLPLNTQQFIDVAGLGGPSPFKQPHAPTQSQSQQAHAHAQQAQQQAQSRFANLMGAKEAFNLNYSTLPHGRQQEVKNEDTVGPAQSMGMDATLAATSTFSPTWMTDAVTATATAHDGMGYFDEGMLALGHHQQNTGGLNGLGGDEYALASPGLKLENVDEQGLWSAIMDEVAVAEGEGTWEGIAAAAAGQGWM